MQRFDVIILGGGLVGLSLAIALGRHGVTCAVIDPARSRGDDRHGLRRPRLLLSFSGLTNNSTLTLTNDMGSFAFKIHYSDYDGNGSNDLFLSTADTKKQLSWATATGANPSQGTLNPALIPTSSAATGVRYTNVNEQGYDIVAGITPSRRRQYRPGR